MAKGKSFFTAGNVVAIIVVAIAVIFLLGKFTGTGTCTQENVDAQEHGCEAAGDTYTTLDIPEQAELESSTLWLVRLLLLGFAVYIAAVTVAKFTDGRITRRDLFSLVMLGIAVYFAYVYVIEPYNILGASSFDEIAKQAALKLGFGG